jgi:hypothetical protein
MVAGSIAWPGVPTQALRLRRMRKVVPWTSTVTPSSACTDPLPMAPEGPPTVRVTR